ncbi:MAG: DinB family protein [Acidobacteria bacterium]|nr:DinB family protein [Acidobacteriota bacterium]
MSRVAAISELLKRTAAALRSVADQVPADKWQQQPKSGGWSAAEIIAHLTMVEDAATGKAAKVVKHPPNPLSFRDRVMKAPAALVRTFVVGRIVRRQTPIPLDPQLLSDKESMLARYADRRKQTLSLLEESGTKNLAAYYWKHPFFGNLDYYTWFRLIGWHEMRHTKQIREIVDSFKV